MIKAVLFDMDGTLLDTEGVYRSCWSRAMEEVGVCVDREQFFLAVAGMNMSDIKAYCLCRYGESFPFDALNEARRRLLSSYLAKSLPACKAGVPEVPDALRKQGIRLALATSSRLPYATELLSRVGIMDRFEAIVTGEQVTRSKPDPEIFLRAAEALGVAPSACVVVEDSANGVRAGHAAGMRTVMVPDLQPCTEELEPLLWARLDSLEGLLPLIEKNNLESENR